ncbi:hypothetical protein DEU56DRAFT_929096 [Suillus clintonianus]|uniref:uncharacterized protein n=1 Tax=Suillus clintonianus TaxID=1904413 RepID=UPI001B873EDF|nr:uncharacterized protein DEU56DRAFT_929096 [Suillus clintonianus]KAG2119340.1 hypothetical protein DEU56DRAFT_929096 [Suillus clintonianus]
MSLKRVGGKSDGGIDLLGCWWLPLSEPQSSQSTPITLPHRRIHVLAQCKAEKRNSRQIMFGRRKVYGICTLPLRPPPPHVSELGTVALLLSESKFTTVTLTRALGSNFQRPLSPYAPPTSTGVPRSTR